MRRIASVALGAMVVLALGCMPQPPAPPTPRDAMPIMAPQARTWDAVIEVFADRNIPIRNMERVSGFIATDRLRVAGRDGLQWADCGVDGYGRLLLPAWAAYNVLVRGSDTASMVKVTVDWTQFDGSNCSTKGAWETDMERGIKARAEGRQVKASAGSAPQADAPVAPPKSAAPVGAAASHRQRTPLTP